MRELSQSFPHNFVKVRVEWSVLVIVQNHNKRSPQPAIKLAKKTLSKDG
jgi:hypothetical protein